MNNLIVIDFETYYDKDYGLRKYTTEEYIRSDKFEVIGVAVKENQDETVWCTGTHSEIQKFLSTFDFEGSFCIGHNMRFDGAILNWIFNIRPLGLMDTMGMGQILHGLTESVSLKNLSRLYNIGEKGTEVLDALGKHRKDFKPNEIDRYGDYCINDVDLTYHLFHHMISKFTAIEIKLIDLTIRMFTEPKLVIDKVLLLKHLDAVRTSKQDLLDKAQDIITVDDGESDDGVLDKKYLMSNPKFAELLASLGVTIPVKISATTGKETYAFAKTDEGFISLMNHADERVQILAAARVGNKSTIEESRTENFIGIANRGLLPVPLKYAGATVSHRWSGADGINMQNLPRTSQLRRALCAPKGYKLVVSDLSNIELRLAYWFAQSTAKVDLIKQGIDLYKQSASEITGTSYDKVSKEVRYIFKVVNLSGIYGVGHVKMHSILKAGGVEKDLNEVKNIVYAFRNSNPELVKAWHDAGWMLDAVHAGQGYAMGKNNIITSIPKIGMLKPNKMILGLPGLRKIVDAKTGRDSWVYDKLIGRTLTHEYIHPAKVFQRCIQSLARDIIGEQLVAVSKKYRVVMTVHDELVMLCPENETEECVSFVNKCMTTAPDWCTDLPLGCEIGVGHNYKDAK
tara:strand:- start:1154 stop:3031 length:1878 start_codon:yes stop_codon:yes gene_type:complete